ncbi:STAS domain-containing protein [Streptomyces sp. NPDC001380]|uniref:STAS domain-containing protein n=1 Tax=Streptomyces sp. NPDC001380 TaxID=3364566 RepID=UPI0036A954A5
MDASAGAPPGPSPHVPPDSGPPAPPDSGPAPGPGQAPRADTAVLVLAGPLTAADVPGLCARLEGLLCGGAARVVCDVGRLDAPDAVALEALARLGLTAARRGRHIGLRGAGGRLRALLALTGLDEVLALRSSPPQGC